MMGILNVTPDSFYDGGKYDAVAKGLARVEQMLLEGAAIIDVGGMSTRPGADMLDETIELHRVLPMIEAILVRWPDAILSIDTFRSGVARRCVEAGVSIVNDISGGQLDANMFETVADLKVPYILMHSKGTPQNMQLLTDYDDIALDVLDYFLERTAALKKLGVCDIIVDPGFGFAKSLQQNYELLKNTHIFDLLSVHLMVGISRKSLIYNKLSISKEATLNGTTVLNTYALQQGATILRVHDVREAVEAIRLINALK